MLKIVYKDKEFGADINEIGNINYKLELGNDITGTELIASIIKLMKVMEFSPTVIQQALENALEDLKAQNNS